MRMFLKSQVLKCKSGPFSLPKTSIGISINNSIYNRIILKSIVQNYHFEGFQYSDQQIQYIEFALLYIRCGASQPQKSVLIQPIQFQMHPRSPTHKLAFSNQTNSVQKKFAVPADYRTTSRQLNSDLQKNMKPESNLNDGKYARQSFVNSPRVSERQQAQQMASYASQNSGNEGKQNLDRFQKVREIAEELSKSNSKAKLQEKKEFATTNTKKFQRSKGSEVEDDRPEYSNSNLNSESYKKQSRGSEQIQYVHSNVYNADIPLLKQEIVRRESSRSNKNYENPTEKASSRMPSQSPIVLSDLKGQREKEEAAISSLAKSKSSENLHQFKEIEQKVSRSGTNSKPTLQSEPFHSQNTNNYQQKDPPKSIQPPNTLNFKETPQQIPKNSSITTAQKTKRQTSNAPQTISSPQTTRLQANRIQTSPKVPALADNDYMQKYFESQNIRQQLSRKNTELQSIQMGLKSQIQMLKLKNSQLSKESHQYQQLAIHTNMEANDKISQNERFYSDINHKNEQVTKKLYEKIKECSELKMKYEELMSQCAKIESKARTSQNQQSMHRQDIQKLKRMHQIQINQATLSANDKIMQLQQQIINLKANPNRRIAEDSDKVDKLKQQLEEKIRVIKGQQKEISTLNKELKEKIQMDIELETNIAEREKIYAEVNRLSALLSQQTAAKSQLIRNYELKLLQKDQRIQQLQTTMAFQQQQSKSVNFADKFGSKPSKHKQFNEFEQSIQEMIKQHTQEIAELRDQVIAKEQQSYKFKSQNQDSKNQIRRLQQQLNMIKMTTTSNIDNMNQAKKSAEIILKSQLENARRRQEVLQMQMRDLEAQLQQKDVFIKKNILSLDKSTNPEGLLAKLEQALHQN